MTTAYRVNLLFLEHEELFNRLTEKALCYFESESDANRVKEEIDKLIKQSEYNVEVLELLKKYSDGEIESHPLIQDFLDFYAKWPLQSDSSLKVLKYFFSCHSRFVKVEKINIM